MGCSTSSLNVRAEKVIEKTAKTELKVTTKYKQEERERAVIKSNGGFTPTESRRTSRNFGNTFYYFPIPCFYLFFSCFLSLFRFLLFFFLLFIFVLLNAFILHIIYTVIFIKMFLFFILNLLSYFNFISISFSLVLSRALYLMYSYLLSLLLLYII